jgi:hypothetical protein
MRSCHPGRPLLVDRSEENALAVADTLDRAAGLAVAAGSTEAALETATR